jgi:predicted secreted protein
MKTVCYVAHCLLNANAKVEDGARCAGVYSPVLALLRDHGCTIRQMPCPELAFGGSRRFWAVREQYDTTAFRRHCRRIAAAVAGAIEVHVARGDDVILVGIDGSPSMGVHVTSSDPARGGRGATRIPSRFWIFGAFAVLYGICETMNGNWAQVDMTQNLAASATLASLALTAFWGMVTVGRVLFALIERRFPTRRTYHLLPFVLAAALVMIARLPKVSPCLGIMAFALAGLGCSALLPLTISFAQEQLVVMTASAAGGVIALYQLGYGIAAFGAGPLQDAGVGLPTLYGLTAVAAVVMGGLSFVLTGRQPAAKAAAARP